MKYNITYKINGEDQSLGVAYADKDSEAYTLAYKKAEELARISPVDRPGLKDAKTLVEILKIVNEDDKRELNLEGKTTKVGILEIKKLLENAPIDE